MNSKVIELLKQFELLSKEEQREILKALNESSKIDWQTIKLPKEKKPTVVS